MSRGPARRASDDKIAEVVTRALETMPDGATHWSRRSMARATGISATTVHRRGAFGLQPHRVESFKLSSDPEFIDKMRDIVGLYLDPPDRALVLCIDEKSQIQALDRTQPMLPMRPGQAERRSHDYKRHGTTTLFAALDTATGAVIGSCMKRHRAREFRSFLDEVESAVPADLDIHVVMDNASSHKTGSRTGSPSGRAGTATSPRHPRGSTRSSASALDRATDARRPQIDRRWSNPPSSAISKPTTAIARSDGRRRRHPASRLPKDTQPYRSWIESAPNI